ncbi:MAG: hypothetical protein RL025_1553 [Bacteroidota bacterium]
MAKNLLISVNHNTGLTFFCFFILHFLFVGRVFAQTAVLSGGGDVFNGSGASLAVSIGETVSGQYDYSLASGVVGQAGVQQPFEWLIPGLQLKTRLHYLNAVQSPLPSVLIQLRNSQGQQMAVGTTDAQGTADLGMVMDGNYSLVISDNRAWSGVNGTDALLVNRAFTGMSALSGLKALAGDVNLNSHLNNNDALLIMRRTSGSLASFGSSGDWRYSLNHVQVQRQPHQVEQIVGIDALFAGDVNGSYVPGLAPRSQWIALDSQGFIGSQEGLYEIPLRLTGSMDLGAVTLSLELPERLQVYAIRCTRPEISGGLTYHQVGQKLTVVWYGVAPWVVREGEEVLILEVKGEAEGRIRLNRAQSELANGWGEVRDDWQWSAPILRKEVFNSWQVLAYPNPFQSSTNFHLSWPSAGRWSVEVRDMAGRLIWSKNQTVQGPGRIDLPLESMNWSAGAYKAECVFEPTESTSYNVAVRRVLSILKKP